MKSLKINTPDGYKIDKENSTFENIVFKEVLKDIRSRIETENDIFELNGTTKAEFDKKWQGFEKYEKAIGFEFLIVGAYNEGKVPNWTDGATKVVVYKNHRENTLDVFDFRWNTYHSARLLFLGGDAVKNAQDAISKFPVQLDAAKSF